MSITIVIVYIFTCCKNEQIFETSDPDSILFKPGAPSFPYSGSVNVVGNPLASRYNHGKDSLRTNQSRIDDGDVALGELVRESNF